MGASKSVLPECWQAGSACTIGRPGLENRRDRHRAAGDAQPAPVERGPSSGWSVAPHFALELPLEGICPHDQTHLRRWEHTEERVATLCPHPGGHASANAGRLCGPIRARSSSNAPGIFRFSRPPAWGSNVSSPLKHDVALVLPRDCLDVEPVAIAIENVDSNHLATLPPNRIRG